MTGTVHVAVEQEDGPVGKDRVEVLLARRAPSNSSVTVLLPSPTTQWGANVTAAVADWRTRSEATNLRTADLPFIATPQRALEALEGL